MLPVLLTGLLNAWSGGAVQVGKPSVHLGGGHQLLDLQAGQVAAVASGSTLLSHVIAGEV